jgi:predicted aldo/keto reductase-like oxidoreductase
MVAETINAAGTFKIGDLLVGRIGFGAMRLTQDGHTFAGGTSGDRNRAITVLRRAVELGVNHIDTAAFYLSLCRAKIPRTILELVFAGQGRSTSSLWWQG